MENIQYILYISLGLYSIIILILRNSLFNDDEKIIKSAVRISWCHLTTTKIPIDQIKERLQNIV